MSTITRGLPKAVGPLSQAVLDHLTGERPLSGVTDITLSHSDPAGMDLHYALHLCYELFYRGFDGVSDDFEWDPTLLELRGRLEDIFLTDIRRGGSAISPA